MRARIAAAFLLLASPLLWSQGLQYVESSTGLNTPALDTGRSEIVFGDVNGDGNVDLLSIGDHGSPNIGTSEHGVMVWFGDGLGNWSVFQNGNFGYGGIALGDVNNDGLMDIAYGMHHNYSTGHFGDRLEGIALGDGSGQRWRPWDKGVATNGETYGMFGTDLADVNNDGLLDYISNSFGCCAGTHVYLNNGDGTWTQSFGFTGGNGLDDVVFADFNGDGKADFATTNSKGTVYLGDGAGNFTLADGNLPKVPSLGRPGISVGDINDDGIDDLAFVNPAGGLSVYTMTSDGVWQQIPGLPASGRMEATQIADMNNDGHGDVIGFGRGTVAIYSGDGHGNFTVTTFTTPGRNGYAAFRAGTDLDHNGYPDIGVMADERDGINHLRVYVESTLATAARIYPVTNRLNTLVPGAVRRIEWTSAVPRGSAPVVIALEYSTSGPEGPWSPIATTAPDSGSYQWRIPQSLAPQSRCFIRYRLILNGIESAAAVGPARQVR